VPTFVDNFSAPPFHGHRALVTDGVSIRISHRVAPDVIFVFVILGNSSLFGVGFKIYRGLFIDFPGISVHVSDNIKIITITHAGSHPIGSVTFYVAGTSKNPQRPGVYRSRAS
jgi:hypothetical protein